MGIHLVVEYMDHSRSFYPVEPDEGWKIRPADRVLVVGRGVPRIEVPLDNVRHYSIEECHPVPIVGTQPREEHA